MLLLILLVVVGETENALSARFFHFPLFIIFFVIFLFFSVSDFLCPVKMGIIKNAYLSRTATNEARRPSP